MNRLLLLKLSVLVRPLTIRDKLVKHKKKHTSPSTLPSLGEYRPATPKRFNPETGLTISNRLESARKSHMIDMKSSKSIHYTFELHH